MTEEARKSKREYYKKYRETNRDKINKYLREWRKNNKDKVKQHNQRYWQKKAEENKE